MQQYVQTSSNKPEAGGVLLGRHLLQTPDIIVDLVTVPLPGDSQSRFRFWRAKELHQKAINQAWNESRGTCTYLGEWHTHPESTPVPSIIDHLNWQRKLLVDRFTNPLFFIIMGIEQLCVWEGYTWHLPVALECYQND